MFKKKTILAFGTNIQFDSTCHQALETKSQEYTIGTEDQGFIICQIMRIAPTWNAKGDAYIILHYASNKIVGIWIYKKIKSVLHVICGIYPIDVTILKSPRMSITVPIYIS